MLAPMLENHLLLFVLPARKIISDSKPRIWHAEIRTVDRCSSQGVHGVSAAGQGEGEQHLQSALSVHVPFAGGLLL